MMIKTIVLYILIVYLTLIQGHRSARKQTLLPQLSCKVFNQFRLSLAILLRLVGVMNPILILCCPLNIQGRELNLCDFVVKALTLACVQSFTD